MTLTRRTLLGAAAAGGAAALLAGCGGGGGSGDRLRVAFPGGGSRETLDPHVLPAFLDQARAKACFDVLAGWDDDMKPVPRLAESWESDPSGTRWNVRLRRATWHDGRPVTAADVLATWRRIADPATKASAATLYRGVDLSASRARSETELDVVLGAPNTFFPLSWGAPGAEIVPGGTVDPSRPVGSGPFRFASFDPGRSVVYRAFEGYWDGAPATRELEFVSIDDENARIGALLSGQIAWVHDLRPTSSQQLLADARTRVLSAPRSNNLSLHVRVDRPPFTDPRLREAVRLGIDRDALLRIVLLGRGEVGNDLFGPGSQYYPTQVPQVTRDVGRARALVAEAGATGLGVELQTSTAVSLFPAAAQLISQQLGEIGLAATPRTLPPETYFTAVRTSGVSSLSRTGALPIPDFLARRAVTGATSNNYTGYRNPEIDRLVAVAAAATDDAARTAATQQAMLLLRAESGTFFWASGAYDVGVSADLRGYDAARPNSIRWARFDKASLG